MRRHGQAMVEFVIAILVVVILTAGILTFTELAGRRGELQSEIRSEAGARALEGRVELGARPADIRDWQPGPDQTRHTADDLIQRGNSANTLQASVLSRSVRNREDWHRLDESRNRSLYDLYNSNIPLSNLGFVHAELRDTLPLMPAMDRWLMGRETITVGASLWFPVLELEYFSR